MSSILALPLCVIPAYTAGMTTPTTEENAPEAVAEFYASCQRAAKKERDALKAEIDRLSTRVFEARAERDAAIAAMKNATAGLKAYERKYSTTCDALDEALDRVSRLRAEESEAVGPNPVHLVPHYKTRAGLMGDITGPDPKMAFLRDAAISMLPALKDDEEDPFTMAFWFAETLWSDFVRRYVCRGEDCPTCKGAKNLAAEVDQAAP